MAASAVQGKATLNIVFIDARSTDVEPCDRAFASRHGKSRTSSFQGPSSTRSSGTARSLRLTADLRLCAADIQGNQT
jgi:hypothetical protein